MMIAVNANRPTSNNVIRYRRRSDGTFGEFINIDCNDKGESNDYN